MAVNDVFKVAAVGSLNDQTIVNVFHYRQSTVNSSTLSNLESLARAFNAGPLAAMALASSEEISWSLIEARTFTPPSIPLAGYDLAVSVVGTNEDIAAPPTVCWVVRKRTALLGRKYRGRNYFAGMGMSDVDAGTIAAAGITKYQTARNAIGASITWTASGSPTFIPCIAALDPSVTGPVAGVRATDITSVFLDTVLRSQRRREIGRGS